MKLDQEQLNKIKELAGLFLRVDEIAISIDVDIEELEEELTNKKSAAFLAYFKGKTESKIALRRNVVEMALQRSPQAEEMVEKYIHQHEAYDRKHDR